MSSTNKSKLVGWVISGLLSAFLIFASAGGKFTEWEGKEEMFGKLGWSESVMVKIGIVEVAIAVLFLIPHTAFVAAILLSAYLGGAVATHVRVGDPFFFPIIIGVVAWIALGLRQPAVFALAAVASPRSPRLSCLLLLVGLVGTSVRAETPSQQLEVPTGHAWLKQFIGAWETTSKGIPGPDQPPIECAGTIQSRALGDSWVINEMQAVVHAAPMIALQTLGYDTTKQKYVGTWVDSMSGHMWVYEGTVDETGRKLTLEAEGPNMMMPGKTTKFRDSYEFSSPDHFILTSSMLSEEGTWITFLTGEGHRSKSKPD